jgi:perosamine synthetase
MDGITKVGGGVLPQEGQDHPVGDHDERSRGKQVAKRPLIMPKLPLFNRIGKQENFNVKHALKRPLSGYIGGKSFGGYWITRLSEEWCETFGCRYAIPCNSATSGLLAACMAAGIGEGDEVWVSDYTMSASASCAIVLGANVRFIDINPMTFNMMHLFAPVKPKAIIITNLFGQPAPLAIMRAECNAQGIVLIEDNAQAPFAKEYGKYTGTIGHMGVFSLNVHKHIQAGEGGVVVTDDPNLAHRLDCAINHGELMKVNPHPGLNLRMTEPIAAVASAQLKKGPDIVRSRIELAHNITRCFEGIDFIEAPFVREDCEHVYYLWAGKVLGSDARDKRHALINALAQRGIPFRTGYSPPLHRVWGSHQDDTAYPITVSMEDHRLFVFEICAYDPKAHHLKIMKKIIHQEAANLP